MEISDHDLAQVPLEDDLRDAVLLGRRITKHGGRRRQLQYVAKWLRTFDTAPIATAIESLRHLQQNATLRTHTVEEWRTKLIDEGDPAVAALGEQCPGIDPTVILRLIGDARLERHEGRPQRAFRELFTVLWDLLAT
jgi:ribosome-associated protein